jgi:hypothetical protein
MNREFYNISKGLKKKNKTDYFGYDTKKRIILLIQDEGRVQFYYTYNDKEQIITETVLGVTIVYEYDTLGRKVKRSSKTQKIKYEYYKNSLLEREVIDGSNGGIWNYLYE